MSHSGSSAEIERAGLGRGGNLRSGFAFSPPPSPSSCFFLVSCLPRNPYVGFQRLLLRRVVI